MIKLALLVFLLFFQSESLPAQDHETLKLAEITPKQTIKLPEPPPEVTKEHAHEPKEKVKTDSSPKEVKAPETPQKFTQSELLLARLVRAEAQGEPFRGKVAVAQVVLNRVASDSFPGSITGVIYQSGQFQPVANGAINEPATKESKRAVKVALNKPSDGSLYFYNPDISTADSWFNTMQTTKVIGNHTFKK